MPLPPPPPPPPPAPPPPPPGGGMPSAPPAKAKDRNALLQDIQKGRTLKKTVTNDRSAPIVDGSKPSSSPAHAHSRPAPGGGASTKFPAPAIPTGSLNFADELSRRIGGGGLGRGVGKNSNDSCSATNGGGSTPAITPGASTPTANGNSNSRPLPPPPPPTSVSTPNFSSKPTHSQAPKPVVGSVKPMAPQPNRLAATSNGAGRNFSRPSESPDDTDGRFKGPSVKDQMRAFANANQAPPPPPPPPPPSTLKQRLSTENSWNGECNDDGTYATKAAPPPPPSKPPSKPPQKDSRFHTLNPARMRQGGQSIARSGSHENLPAIGDSLQPPAPPPKVSTARSPGSVARPAPPPPGRPPPPPDRPQVAPPPPPPPTAPPPPPAQKSTQNMNGRHNAYGSRNNEPILRHVHADHTPAPPVRRESLMPDLERRFNFLMLHELPAPDEFRGLMKIYGGRPSQQRRNAPEPPTHR